MGIDYNFREDINRDVNGGHKSKTHVSKISIALFALILIFAFTSRFILNEDFINIKRFDDAAKFRAYLLYKFPKNSDVYALIRAIEHNRNHTGACHKHERDKEDEKNVASYWNCDSHTGIFDIL